MKFIFIEHYSRLLARLANELVVYSVRFKRQNHSDAFYIAITFKFHCVRRCEHDCSVTKPDQIGFMEFERLLN